MAAAETLPALEDIYLPHRPEAAYPGHGGEGAGSGAPRRSVVWRRPDIGSTWPPSWTPSERSRTRRQRSPGARDVIAEDVSEDSEIRRDLRQLFAQRALLVSSVVKKKQAEAAKFRDYFAWSEPLTRAPSHQILAVLRGANEGFLRVQARPDEADALMRAGWALLPRARLRHRAGSSGAGGRVQAPAPPQPRA